MRRVASRLLSCLAGGFLAGGFLSLGLAPGAAQAQGAGLACPSLPPRAAMPRAARPEYLEEPFWRARVAELSQATRTDLSWANVAFLGDSITQGWVPLLFDQFYGHRGGVNLGVGGDFTQGMLWRLQEGGQWPASLRPKVAVLLIGTNNALFNPPEDTALGVAEVVRLIRRLSPATKVLLVGLLPRGPDASDPARRVNAQVNALVARCADNQAVFYTDPGSMMVDGQGRLSDQIAFDRLHLTMVGYAMLGAGLEPSIRYLLGR